MQLHGTQAVNSRGHLTISGCDIVDLARDYGTPLYVMDEAELRRNCRAWLSEFAATGYAHYTVAYAAKAFLCRAMAALVYGEGLHLDVVSGGEIYTATQAGVPGRALIFHGNNKTAEELTMALEVGVGRVAVDSISELQLLTDLVKAARRRPRIWLRLTPGIEAITHQYIATGQLDSKFGIPIATGEAMAAVRAALGSDDVELMGVHCHIGSQISDLGGYRLAAETMISFLAQVKAETGWAAPELNLGGGFGISYTDGEEALTPAVAVPAIVAAVRRECARRQLPLPHLYLEPGRAIAGPAGITVYSVGAIKTIPGVRTYAAVDGGMADNPRPALYQAAYGAVVANRALEPCLEVVSIAGRACESGDLLIWDLPVPKNLRRGDLLAVFATGAYNFSMASHYNRFPRPPVLFVQDGRAEVVVRRETWADLVAADLLPTRFTGPTP